jgi:hypothetical protein
MFHVQRLPGARLTSEDALPRDAGEFPRISASFQRFAHNPTRRSLRFARNDTPLVPGRPSKMIRICVASYEGTI